VFQDGPLLCQGISGLAYPKGLLGVGTPLILSKKVSWERERTKFFHTGKSKAHWYKLMGCNFRVFEPCGDGDFRLSQEVIDFARLYRDELKQQPPMYTYEHFQTYLQDYAEPHPFGDPPSC
jgi:hypothetical protein